MAGKTRTNPAHGPQAAKKAFKADKTQLKSAAAGRTASDRKPAGAARTGSSAAGPNRTSAGAGGPADRKRKAEDEPEKAVVKTSLLNAPEEIDFPRGGGTTLTQVEVREAQLEGAREAEQEGADVSLAPQNASTCERPLIMFQCPGRRKGDRGHQGQEQGEAKKARTRTPRGADQGEEPLAEGCVPNRALELQGAFRSGPSSSSF